MKIGGLPVVTRRTRRPYRDRATAVLATLLVVTFVIVSPARAVDKVTVSAAISLKPVLDELAPEVETRTGSKPAINYGASGALLGQIKAGAPVDVFIAAAPKQVDDLFAAGLGVDGTRTEVARGRLVLVVPANHGDAGITSLADLGTHKVKTLTIGQPQTVPAGQYASQALAKTGLTTAVAQKLVLAANVRQSLDYVARGEVDAGIVYATDAQTAGDAVKVVETIDDSLHDPVLYVAAAVKNGPNPDAGARLLALLKSEPALRAFAKHGFGPAEAPTASPVSTSTTRPAVVPAR